MPLNKCCFTINTHCKNDSTWLTWTCMLGVLCPLDGIYAKHVELEGNLLLRKFFLSLPPSWGWDTQVNTPTKTQCPSTYLHPSYNKVRATHRFLYFTWTHSNTWKKLPFQVCPRSDVKPFYLKGHRVCHPVWRPVSAGLCNEIIVVTLYPNFHNEHAWGITSL